MNQTKAIIKTLYCRPRYENNPRTGRMEKVRDDFLMYVEGDSEGNREIKFIKQPTYTYYVAKEPLGYQRLSVDKEKVFPTTVPYAQRHKYMAESVGLGAEWDMVKRDWAQKRQWIQNNIYNNPQLYQADMDIEEMFKLNYIEQNGDYTADIPYRVSFSDIETDGTGGLNNMDSTVAEGPITLIQHIDVSTSTIYAIALNNPNVPEIKNTFADLGSFVNEFNTYLESIRQECLERTIKGKGKAESVHPFKFNYEFFLFDDEKDVIIKYFDIIRQTRPDTVGIWNMNYDLPYIATRAKKHGLNMADLVSDPAVPPEYRFFDYIPDHERTKEKVDTHFSRFFDKVYSTSVTQWYCQQSLHSNLRKRFLEPSYKLTEIGDKYANVRKVDLADEGYSVVDVYYKNFKLFLKYGLMDVIVQCMIEHVNQDIPRYFSQCATVTFEHGIKKTYAIKNEIYRFLKEKGEVIGNNRTYNMENVEKLEGAVVASPSLIGEKGVELLGSKSYIYRNCVDLDVASEYPNIIIAYNIIKSTTWGRLMQVFNPMNTDGFNIHIPIMKGNEFNRYLQTLDSSIFELGEKAFGLPSANDVLKMAKQYVTA